jgi:hypothetical protein
MDEVQYDWKNSILRGCWINEKVANWAWHLHSLLLLQPQIKNLYIFREQKVRVLRRLWVSGVILLDPSRKFYVSIMICQFRKNNDLRKVKNISRDLIYVSRLKIFKYLEMLDTRPYGWKLKAGKSAKNVSKKNPLVRFDGKIRQDISNPSLKYRLLSRQHLNSCPTNQLKIEQPCCLWSSHILISVGTIDLCTC